ncbi:MAG: tRNA (N6-isopentenyl adenosine(37)-C2)-methylthiotransferase MiaB [Anaerolineales bacterium]|nr:MAG: tRNA (N6-isopentenyl adenosine(37)-C2)-methylthiotransferase MiaB [Anaerolineales bacterium]
MRYHIWTAGCQMNVADSQRVASALEKLGYLPSPRAEDSDVIVLNTCVVRQSAEDKAYGWLHSLRPLKARRPDVVINLMGCLVGINGNPKLRAAFPFVDVFSPPSDLAPLIEHLLRLDVGSPQPSETKYNHALMDGDWVLPQSERGRLVSAYVPVIEGCSHACSFCVIPLRRGVERSRPMDEITAEVRCLAKQGVREVTLLGQIVDRYGKDLPDGTTLADLLRAVHEIEDIERIRFLTSHPNWMTDELIETVAELPKVCEHIEVAVQSGDDQVLRRMKRGYTTEDYRLLIKQIRQRLPETSLATDIIVGFPGETTTQFQRTYQLLEELRFDVVHLARYSPRPVTVAARRMEDDVPQEEKMRRFRALEELQAQIAGEINAGYLGRTVEVLVEEMHQDRWKGRTRTNKLVFFKSDDDLSGRTVPVRIEWASPWSMRGVPAVDEVTSRLVQIKKNSHITTHERCR